MINNFNFLERYKSKNIFIILISISFFSFNFFFIHNFFEFSDPTKILFTQNNIAEKNFCQFFKKF